MNKGKFVVHKSSPQFSSMAIDQTYEQAYAIIKCTIGVTKDPSALRRWMVAGPEVGQLLGCHWKQLYQPPRANRTGSKVLLEKVGKLSATMKEMGNPFQKETRDLLRQDTKDIAHPAAAEMTGTHLERGITQFQEFMKGL